MILMFGVFLLGTMLMLASLKHAWISTPTFLLQKKYIKRKREASDDDNFCEGNFKPQSLHQNLRMNRQTRKHYALVS